MGKVRSALAPQAAAPTPANAAQAIQQGPPSNDVIARAGQDIRRGVDAIKTLRDGLRDNLRDTRKTLDTSDDNGFLENIAAWTQSGKVDRAAGATQGHIDRMSEIHLAAIAAMRQGNFGEIQRLLTAARTEFTKGTQVLGALSGNVSEGTENIVTGLRVLQTAGAVAGTLATGGMGAVAMGTAQTAAGSTGRLLADDDITGLDVGVEVLTVSTSLLGGAVGEKLANNPWAQGMVASAIGSAGRNSAALWSQSESGGIDSKGAGAALTSFVTDSFSGMLANGVAGSSGMDGLGKGVLQATTGLVTSGLSLASGMVSGNAPSGLDVVDAVANGMAGARAGSVK